MPISSKSLIACESLTLEHRATEKLLEKLESMLNNLNPEHPLSEEDEKPLRQLFGQLKNELAVHFVCEEEGLFPVLSRYHPMVLMELEHDDLMALRDKFEALLEESGQNPPAVRQLVETGLTWSKELQDHIGREDHGIFPTAEKALNEKEKQQVIEAMAKIRREAQMQIPKLQRDLVELKPFEMNLEKLLAKPVDIQLLAEQGMVQIKQLDIQGGQEMKRYWSPKTIALVLVSGNAQLISDNPDESMTLKPGQGALMTPRFYHGIKALEDSRFLMMMHAG